MTSAPCLSSLADCDPSACTNVTACRPPSRALPSEYTLFSLEWSGPYQALYASMPVHPLAFSLPNVWAWRDWMGLEVRFDGGLAWLRCRNRGTHSLAPAGPWQNIDWIPLRDQLASMGTIYQVPEALAQIWESAFGPAVTLTENRDYWEYVYLAEDLANLAGKRYHMQRNHVNAYIRENGMPDLRPLGPADREAMMALTARWHAAHTVSDSTEAEVASLGRVCEQWQAMDLVADGLFLNDTLVAFAVGHALDGDTLAVMYEKAEPGVRGAFPVMASAFARHALDLGKTWVNRAEDMGEEGMRKSKMLYRPVDFQRMYIARF